MSKFPDPFNLRDKITPTVPFTPDFKKLQKAIEENTQITQALVQALTTQRPFTLHEQSWTDSEKIWELVYGPNRVPDHYAAHKLGINREALLVQMKELGIPSTISNYPISIFTDKLEPSSTSGDDCTTNFQKEFMLRAVAITFDNSSTNTITLTKQTKYGVNITLGGKFTMVSNTSYLAIGDSSDIFEKGDELKITVDAIENIAHVIVYAQDL